MAASGVMSLTQIQEELKKIEPRKKQRREHKESH